MKISVLVLLIMFGEILIGHAGSVEVYPFSPEKIKESVNSFIELEEFPDLQGVSFSSYDKFSECSGDTMHTNLEKEIKVVFSKVLKALSPKLRKTIQLKKCTFDSGFVASAKNKSVYYSQSALDILTQFQPRQRKDVAALVLGHEVAHFIHEYSTQKNQSSYQGLSLHGTLSLYQWDEDPNELLSNIDRCGQSKAPFKTLLNDHISFKSKEECLSFSLSYFHYEVDAMGAEFVKRYNPSIDFSLFIEFLEKYNKIQIGQENDIEYETILLEQQRKRAKLIRESFQRL